MMTGSEEGVDDKMIQASSEGLVAVEDPSDWLAKQLHAIGGPTLQNVPAVGELSVGEKQFAEAIGGPIQHKPEKIAGQVDIEGWAVPDDDDSDEDPCRMSAAQEEAWERDLERRRHEQAAGRTAGRWGS